MQTARATQPVEPGRLEALRARHAQISSKLERIQKRPAAQDADLKELKRQKLMLKDQIEIEQLNGNHQTH